MSKPLNALKRIFGEAFDNVEDQLWFLRFGGGGGQYPGQSQDEYGQTCDQYGQHDTLLHQTGGQIQTPYKPRVKWVNSPGIPPCGGDIGGPFMVTINKGCNDETGTRVPRRCIRIQTDR